MFKFSQQQKNKRTMKALDAFWKVNCEKLAMRLERWLLPSLAVSTRPAGKTYSAVVTTVFPEKALLLFFEKAQSYWNSLYSVHTSKAAAQKCSIRYCENHIFQNSISFCVSFCDSCLLLGFFLKLFFYISFCPLYEYSHSLFSPIDLFYTLFLISLFQIIIEYPIIL